MTRTVLHSPTMGDLPETASVDDMPTAAAPGLAWSAETEAAEPEPEQPSRRGAVITAMAVAASIAAVIGAVYVVRNSLAAPTPAASTAQSVIVEPPAEQSVSDDAVAPPAALTALPDAKQKASPAQIYITVLSEAGMSFNNPADADGSGHEMCAYISHHSPAALVDNILTTGHFSGGEAPTPEQAAVLAHAAIVAYCPQYGER